MSANQSRVQQTTTGNMSYTHLLARAISNYNPNRSNTQRTATAVGIAGAVFLIGIVMTGLVCSRNRNKSQDPESVVARSQQRRENDGWWGAAPSLHETAVERRRRNLEIRATTGGGCEVEGGARNADVAPPVYQPPAPTYNATPELTRQDLDGRRQTPLPPLVDAPPPYNSPAVWPARA